MMNEGHVILKQHGVNVVFMANDDENQENNLELAIALVDEDNIDELETILQDSLDEMSGKNAVKCIRPKGVEIAMCLTNTRHLRLRCRKMI